jgi:hypothetical protein
MRNFVLPGKKVIPGNCPNYRLHAYAGEKAHIQNGKRNLKLLLEQKIKQQV